MDISSPLSYTREVNELKTLPFTTSEGLGSPLLNLPPEIRENIWRLVLGVEGETIHLYHHLHTAEDNGHQSTPHLQLDDSSDKRYLLRPSRCRKAHEWDLAYQLSQRTEEFSSDARDRRGRLREDAKDVLTTYNSRHRHCRQPDVKCQDGHHTMQCRASSVGLNVECICDKKKELDLSLLRVCRSIYFEAAHLPYKLNTFSFPNEANLAFFANAILKPWQREIIQTIEVASESAIVQSPPPAESGVESVANSEDVSVEKKANEEEIDMEDFSFDDGLESSLCLFPNLQQLKLSIPFVKNSYLPKLRTPQSSQGKIFDVPVIPKAKVIVGADTDSSKEYEMGSREERRELAVAVEKFLQGKSHENEARTSSWWKFLLCNGRAVPCKNSQESALKAT